MMDRRKLTERRAAPTDVLVVLPTFNEKDNVERVVAGVRHLGHDILIVDDGSPDGTGEIADRLAASDSGVRVLHRERKLGIGSAYEDGFRVGLAEGSGLFVEMDADGSHRARDLDAIVDAARGCGGLAIGSRYVRGGHIVGWPAHRLLLSVTPAPSSRRSGSTKSYPRATPSRSRWSIARSASATRWSRCPSSSRIASPEHRRFPKERSAARCGPFSA